MILYLRQLCPLAMIKTSLPVYWIKGSRTSQRRIWAKGKKHLTKIQLNHVQSLRAPATRIKHALICRRPIQVPQRLSQQGPPRLLRFERRLPRAVRFQPINSLHAVPCVVKPQSRQTLRAYISANQKRPATKVAPTMQISQDRYLSGTVQLIKLAV